MPSPGLDELIHKVGEAAFINETEVQKGTTPGEEVQQAFADFREAHGLPDDFMKDSEENIAKLADSRAANGDDYTIGRRMEPTEVMSIMAQSEKPDGPPSAEVAQEAQQLMEKYGMDGMEEITAGMCAAQQQYDNGVNGTSEHHQDVAKTHDAAIEAQEVAVQQSPATLGIS